MFYLIQLRSNHARLSDGPEFAIKIEPAHLALSSLVFGTCSLAKVNRGKSLATPYSNRNVINVGSHIISLRTLKAKKRLHILHLSPEFDQMYASMFGDGYIQISTTSLLHTFLLPGRHETKCHY